MRVGINEAASTHATATENKDAVEQVDAHEPEEPQGRQPQELTHIPVGLWKIGVLPTLALLYYQHIITFLSEPHGRNTASEARTDNDVVECLVHRKSC